SVSSACVHEDCEALIRAYEIDEGSRPTTASRKRYAPVGGDGVRNAGCGLRLEGSPVVLLAGKRSSTAARGQDARGNPADRRAAVIAKTGRVKNAVGIQRRSGERPARLQHGRSNKKTIVRLRIAGKEKEFCSGNGIDDDVRGAA